MNLLMRPVTVYSVAALLSLLLSLYAGLHIDVINPDAICYLQSAQMMGQGVHAAMHLCAQAQWPLYSGLIYLTSQVTHLTVTSSAYLLNSMLSLITVLAFIAIVQQIDFVADKIVLRQRVMVMWLAAIVILLAHELNALKQDVIRDHGFMAFYLLSIFSLLIYFKNRTWRAALGFGLSLSVATLFRIEGAVFWALMPFLVWVDSRYSMRARFQSFWQLHAVLLAGVMVLVGWLIVHPTIELSRLHELHYQLLHGWQDAWHNFNLRTQLLANNVLTQDGVRDAHLIFVLTMVAWYGVQVMVTLSWIYAGLVIFAWSKRVLQHDRSARYVLWGYVVVNLIITFAFLVEHLFLSKRYLMALALVLMIWVPLGLRVLFSQYKKRQGWCVLISLLIILSSLGGIKHFGYSKTYLREAGEWLSLNVPMGAALYSNDYQVMYYSNHYGNAIFNKMREFTDMKVTTKHQWQQFDYLAIRHNKDESINMTGLTPVKTFKNRRGDTVDIYRISH